jgi:protein-S-isoprenylcysteine O-methyltransferase Ste14
LCGSSDGAPCGGTREVSSAHNSFPHLRTEIAYRSIVGRNAVAIAPVQFFPERSVALMWILVRAVTYATFFVGMLLLLLPASLLSFAGVARPSGVGLQQVLGATLTVAGAALGSWCILTFVFVGKGTQAPFDPPRQLVIRGPYRALRNPMFAGATLALTGAAVYYDSLALLAYALVFWLLTHLGIVFYEEPVLRKTFGVGYADYCEKTGRWWPR